MSDEKAKPSCPFCATVVAPYGKAWVCPNEECEFVQPMTLDGISRRTRTPSHEDLVKALERTQADNLAIQGYIEDGCEASALAQLRSSYAKTKAALISPLPPSKSEDLARDAVVEAAKELAIWADHLRGLSLDGEPKKLDPPTGAVWKALRSSPPTPRKSEDEIRVNWHEEGGGLIYPTKWGFVLYEVPQFGGEPRFVGHYDKLEAAKAVAEGWT